MNLIYKKSNIYKRQIMYLIYQRQTMSFTYLRQTFYRMYTKTKIIFLIKFIKDKNRVVFNKKLCIVFTQITLYILHLPKTNNV